MKIPLPFSFLVSACCQEPIPAPSDEELENPNHGSHYGLYFCPVCRNECEGHSLNAD